MDHNQLYARILDLSTLWFVSDENLDESNSLVEVRVECDASVRLCCPMWSIYSAIQQATP